MNERLEDCAARGFRDAAVQARPVLRIVFAVAAEQFISADSGKQHGRCLCGLAADQVGQEHAGIGDRLVEVPNQAGEKGSDIRLHHDFVMVAAEPLSQPARGRGIVHRWFLPPDRWPEK